MGDSLQGSVISRNSKAIGLVAGKTVSKKDPVASGPKALPRSTYKNIASLSSRNGGGAAGHIAIFLIKLAALEAVRRVSRAKCPYIWRGLQALQVLCYPPLKWIQRWAPLRGLVTGMQMLSRPLLVLSVTTAVTEHSDSRSENSDSVSVSHEYSELHSEISSLQYPLDGRVDDETPGSLASEDWLIRVHRELENQGISLPERINEDELRRFYAAANGDFSCLLSSIKKTIRWRDAYRILSEVELEQWSSMVFWHGFDVKNRPCLVVRLGQACLNLPSHERPRFAQAVVSQVEHGVLHLVDPENREITVLVDCEGLSPLRIPMHMMRSCSSLLQDHFPNHLGCLFVIRLPAVVRVIAQTFIQVLKPVTRRKLKIEGEMFCKVLFEHLQTLPSYLGGHCTCTICSNMSNRNIQSLANGANWIGRSHASNYVANIAVNDSEDISTPHLVFQDDVDVNGNCDQILRTAVISLLMLWVLIALIAGIYDPESRPSYLA